MSDPPKGRPKPRRFKEATPYNAGLYHLQRFGAPRAHLRRKLLERARRSREVHGGDAEEQEGWIDAALDRLEALGYLDDRRYARDKARNLSRKGKPPRAIQQALRVKGVPSELIDEAIASLSVESDPAVRAGAAWLRKRRLGAYDTPPREELNKSLARMARAGYPYAIARTLLEIEEEDTLLELEMGRMALEDIP